MSHSSTGKKEKTDFPVSTKYLKTFSYHQSCPTYSLNVNKLSTSQNQVNPDQLILFVFVGGFHENEVSHKADPDGLYF